MYFSLHASWIGKVEIRLQANKPEQCSEHSMTVASCSHRGTNHEAKTRIRLLDLARRSFLNTAKEVR